MPAGKAQTAGRRFSAHFVNPERTQKGVKSIPFIVKRRIQQEKAHKPLHIPDKTTFSTHLPKRHNELQTNVKRSVFTLPGSIFHEPKGRPPCWQGKPDMHGTASVVGRLPFGGTFFSLRSA